MFTTVMNKAIFVFSVAALMAAGMVFSQEDGNFVSEDLFDDLAADAAALYEKRTDGFLGPGGFSKPEDFLRFGGVSKPAPMSLAPKLNKDSLYYIAAEEEDLSAVRKAAKERSGELNSPAVFHGIKPLREAAPMHIAAIHNPNPDVLKVLQEEGGNVNVTDPDIGATPLHAALYRNRPAEVLRTLIDLGANVNAALSRGKYKGMTPLHVAAGRADKIEAVSILIDSGADKKATFPYATMFGKHEVTPLMLLRHRGNKNMRNNRDAINLLSG